MGTLYYGENLDIFRRYFENELANLVLPQDDEFVALPVVSA